MDNNNINAINVYQKNWAFTSADSDSPKIITSSFGPCYVVTFTSGKFAAMTHIDDTTDVDSITTIFKKFKNNSIDLKDVNVTILGGWKEHPSSFLWGQKILKIIKESGFEKINVDLMHTKKTLTQKLVASEIPLYFYWGALVDSSNGKTTIINERLPKLEQEQTQRNSELKKKYVPGKEYRLTQAF